MCTIDRQIISSTVEARRRRSQQPNSFVNSQEWTLSRGVSALRLGIVGHLASGKSALVHRYLTGSYLQDESPEGGRFKKEAVVDGQSYLLLIRDEGGSPELQFSAWVDAVIFVFSLENEASFNAVYNYYTKMTHYRNAIEVPLILVGTQDAISESNPRVIDDARARKLAADLKRCSYYETCATYGLNVERVFQDACQKIVQQRYLNTLGNQVPTTPTGSRPATPINHLMNPRPFGSSPPMLNNNNGFGGVTSSPSHNIMSTVDKWMASVPVEPPKFIAPPPPSTMDPPRDQPTPSSTPTATRKNRRRSNLFTQARSSNKVADEKSLGKGTEEYGSGRAIPIKQGYLYKKSSKPLNKEWKKKYVTLCDDGRLTYHPSLHDYMENVHGKEVPLQCVTVKLPGQKPKGSKTILPNSSSTSAASSLAEGLGSLGLGAFTKDKGKNDKVTLTSYEYLKDPGSRLSNQSDDSLVIGNTSISIMNGSSAAHAVDMKSETPNVKKRHRRIKSSGLKNNDNDDSDGVDFVILSLHNKQWHFEASSVEERDEWVAAIEQQILSSLQGNESSKAKSRLNSLVDPAAIQALKTKVQGNSHCVDCDAPNPDWASLNLGALMCIECSGIHRNLGSHISKVRSLDLDEWPPGHLSVMRALGNHLVNSVWEANTRGRQKPGPSSSREEKERWIRAKYEGKEFMHPTIASTPLLVDALCRQDMRAVILILANSTPEIVNGTVAPRDMRTPLHLACAMGHLALVQLMLWNGADVRRLDQDGRSALTYAHSLINTGGHDSGANIVEILVQAGCPDPPVGTLARRRDTINRRETISSDIV
ncbi:centaurin-gamma-1A isoform X2 [Neocloeon triangulifer]|uniref:centaurin-gamma-1A isoform X2 n=1 Tax=Neocloeon triangulifer TaxID=2078957 RepID=UPI00286EEF11|nr:centaurin-gamma-1A isoform X2 [Neocloeon triangulifer]